MPNDGLKRPCKSYFKCPSPRAQLTRLDLQRYPFCEIFTWRNFQNKTLSIQKNAGIFYIFSEFGF